LWQLALDCGDQRCEPSDRTVRGIAADCHAHVKVARQVMNALRKDKAPIVLASICSPALAVPK
jgi:hypothetical protein